MKTFSFRWQIAVAMLVVVALGVTYELGRLTHGQDTKAPIISAQDLSAAYKQVAQLVRPSVVYIDTVNTVKPVPQQRKFKVLPKDFHNRQPIDPRDEEELRRFFEMPFSAQPEQELVQRGVGTGFIVSTDGYILTNNHVVENADSMQVKLFDGREVKAELVGRDAKTDIAVIRIQADQLQPAQLGASAQVEVGEIVMAVGLYFPGSPPKRIVTFLKLPEKS